MDKKTIIRNFTRCADRYDKYSDIQKNTAAGLIEQIKESKFSRILEIGCGTGNYTKLLCAKFTNAEIKAVDISARMIEVAKEKLRNEKVDFIVTDAEDLFLNEKVDLITSNACFQWFSNLETALERYNGLLNKNGIISFSIFGPLTFQELNIALKDVLEDATVVADGFLAKEKISFIMEKFFSEGRIKENKYEQTFTSLKDLLEKIKYTGTQGSSLSGRKSFTPQILKKLENAYLGKFKKIKATYQVLFFNGKKI